jgi:hypothetical protein
MENDGKREFDQEVEIQKAIDYDKAFKSRMEEDKRNANAKFHVERKDQNRQSLQRSITQCIRMHGASVTKDVRFIDGKGEGTPDPKEMTRESKRGTRSGYYPFIMQGGKRWLEAMRGG